MFEPSSFARRMCARGSIIAVALVIGLVLGAGCGARVHPRARESAVLDAGLVQVGSPIRMYVTEDQTTSEGGVPTHLRRWQGETEVYALFVASLERTVPFTGPRDEILAAAMGNEVDGRVGPVTFDYTQGVFTASADARLGEHGEGAVRMRAFMSRTRLVIVAVGGRPGPVDATMQGISVHARDEELFFLPRAETTSPDMHGAWGLGFSCRMPGGVTVEQARSGTMRYLATGSGYTAMAYVLADDGQPIDEQATRAMREGRLLEDTEDFAGGVRYRRLLIQGGPRWHAMYFTQFRSFQFSGVGEPTAQDRERATAFFRSCVY